MEWRNYVNITYMYVYTHRALCSNNRKSLICADNTWRRRWTWPSIVNGLRLSPVDHTFSVQLSVHRDGRFGVTASLGPSALTETCQNRSAFSHGRSSQNSCWVLVYSIHTPRIYADYAVRSICIFHASAGCHLSPRNFINTITTRR